MTDSADYDAGCPKGGADVVGITPSDQFIPPTMTLDGPAHRVVGVGLCSCGDRYSLRYMDYDEWMAEHPRVAQVQQGGSEGDE